MPAKGSCCCTTPDTHGLANMWLLDFEYGSILQDFNYVTMSLTAANACAFDEAAQRAYQAGYAYLWDADPPETPIWGPLSRDFVASEVGGLTPSYFWNGHAMPLATTEFSLAAVSRSDGAQYTHGMTGGLMRTDGTHIYTYTDDTATHRKYAEDGTLVASVAVAGINSASIKGLDYSGESEHYHSSDGRNFTAIDSVSLASNWTLDLGAALSFAQGNDGAGGLYLVFGGNMKRYAAGALDWSVAAPTGFANNTFKFGWGGNVYFTRTISGVVNWSKVNGSDGSIAWLTPAPSSTIIFRHSQLHIVHNGVLYLPHNEGILAIDDASGDILWNQDTVACGYGRTVPTSRGLLCCGEYS